MTKTSQISDAEWRVMHEVWLDEPITSRELKERLVSTTGWKIATIKTLLHRLVQRESCLTIAKAIGTTIGVFLLAPSACNSPAMLFSTLFLMVAESICLTYLVQTARLSTDELRYFKNVVQNIVAAESDSVSSDSA